MLRVGGARSGLDLYRQLAEASGMDDKSHVRAHVEVNSFNILLDGCIVSLVQWRLRSNKIDTPILDLRVFISQQSVLAFCLC